MQKFSHFLLMQKSMTRHGIRTFDHSLIKQAHYHSTMKAIFILISNYEYVLDSKIGYFNRLISKGIKISKIVPFVMRDSSFSSSDHKEEILPRVIRIPDCMKKI